MRTEIIGKRVFGSKIDITDPCYDRDTWCRMNDVEIVPGEYECYVQILSNEETAGFGERVSRIGIRKTDELMRDDCRDFYDYLGEIGVDAGMAGFFENKPDFTHEEWMDFYSKLEGRVGKVYLLDIGFFSNSGYGDGGYGVYALRSNKGIVALFIDFIENDDDEEYDDYEEEDDEAEEI